MGEKRFSARRIAREIQVDLELDALRPASGGVSLRAPVIRELDPRRAERAVGDVNRQAERELPRIERLLDALGERQMLAAPLDHERAAGRELGSRGWLERDDNRAAAGTELAVRPYAGGRGAGCGGGERGRDRRRLGPPKGDDGRCDAEGREWKGDQ